MATLQDALQDATRALNVKGIETARLDAELLLAHVLGTTRGDLLLRLSDFWGPKQSQRFQSLIDRRATHEPVARIIGEKEFWSLPFKLNDATLVPRPDSETLVEAALKKIPEDKPVRILDLGTGSGCLLLSLLSEKPKATGFGTDVSEEALEVAKENAKALGLETQAEFTQWNWNEKEPVSGAPYDIVISNPPYIPTRDIEDLSEEVKDFDPHTALDGGADGLDDVRIILSRASEFMKKSGLFYMEVGDGQAEAVMGLFKSAGFSDITAHNDLAGKERVVSGKSLEPKELD